MKSKEEIQQKLDSLRKQTLGFTETEASYIQGEESALEWVLEE